MEKQPPKSNKEKFMLFSYLEMSRSLISKLIELKKDKCQAVYEMHQNKNTKDAIISIILDYFNTGKANSYEKAIEAVEVYYDRFYCDN